MSYRIWSSLGAAVAVVSLLAGTSEATKAKTAPAAGPTFHSVPNGYAVSTPKGWTRIPDSELRKFEASVARSPQAIKYEAGFQREGAAKWFTVPYVLVQVIPYAGGRQLTDMEVADVIKTMAGIDVNKVIREAVNPQAAKRMSNGSLGQPQWDAPAKILRMPFQLDVADVGKVRATFAWHFGRHALVGVYSYALAANFDAEQATFSRINDSFHFDAGFDYSDQLNRTTASIAPDSPAQK